MTEQKESTMKDASFGDVKSVEAPSVDLKPYDGNKVLIEKVEEKEGKYGPCVMVSSVPLTTIGEGENQKEICATRILGLHRQKDGSVVWYSKGAMAEFLKKYDCAHYKDLVGKEAIVSVKVTDNDQQFAELR